MIEKPVIVTEARAGVSQGDLALLMPGATEAAEEMKVEPQDGAGSPEPGGRMRRWRVGDLLDGVYVARSIGSGGVASMTFFEVVEAQVGRVFGNDRRKERGRVVEAHEHLPVGSRVEAWVGAQLRLAHDERPPGRDEQPPLLGRRARARSLRPDFASTNAVHPDAGWGNPRRSGSRWSEG